MGWQRATESPPEEREGPSNPDGSPNFFVDVPSPVDFRCLAELAVATFRTVDRVGHPGELQYKSFSRSGAEIRFPTLRLTRRPNP